MSRNGLDERERFFDATATRADGEADEIAGAWMQRQARSLDDQAAQAWLIALRAMACRTRGTDAQHHAG